MYKPNIKIPCVYMRGGTSKAVFFRDEDLPQDPKERDKVILSAFGSPDRRQIDGMGGAKSGNIASSMAAETFVAEVRRCQKLATGTERVISILKGALELANQAVYEHSGLSDDYSGMGTTLVAAFLLRNTAVVINVGDSRAYHFSAQGVHQVTRDHSIVELMVQRGELTPEQAKTYPGKNLITRAVGTEPEGRGRPLCAGAAQG